MTIIEFLEARISQDEEHARKLAETDRRPVISLANTINHPQRLLAECAAKRAIIEEHSTQEVASLDRETWAQPFIVCKRCAMGVSQIVAPCPTIKAIASIYADHPDYKTEWEL